MNVYIFPSILIHLFVFVLFFKTSVANKNTKKYYIDFISSKPTVITEMNVNKNTSFPSSDQIEKQQQNISEKRKEKKIKTPAKIQIEDPDYIYTNVKPSMANEESAIINNNSSKHTTPQQTNLISTSSAIKTDKDFPYPWYITKLRTILFDSWQSKNISSKNISAVVKFRIYPNGEIRNITLEKSSLNNLFDYSVISAVSDIKKVDPLPADFFEDYLTVYVEFKSSD